MTVQARALVARGHIRQAVRSLYRECAKYVHAEA
jgi:hypothetical protein